MNPIGIVCVCVMFGMVAEVAWTRRFQIWCWWAAQKAGDKAYPDIKDYARRARFVRAYARNLLATRFQIRTMRGIR